LSIDTTEYQLKFTREGLQIERINDNEISFLPFNLEQTTFNKSINLNFIDI